MKDLEGSEVTVYRKKKTEWVKWTVVAEVDPQLPPELEERTKIGLKNFDFSAADTATIFADIFLLLSPQKWETDFGKKFMKQ